MPNPKGWNRATRAAGTALCAVALVVLAAAPCAWGASAMPGALLAAPVKAGSDTSKAGRPGTEKGEAPPTEPGKGDETAGGGKGVVLDAAATEFEAFRLPAGFRNADGTYKQDSLVAQQKKRMDFINKKLAAKFKLSETTHYLIFSDADSATTAAFVKMCEALYANLGKQFGIEPGERIWDGKCILLIFSNRSTFLQYAGTFDAHDATNAGAYFAWEVSDARFPQLVHICLPLAESEGKRSDLRRLQELFAHEGTHAFFQLYKKPVMLPLWLHEGLAEFMTVVNDPSLKSKKQSWALYYARRGTSIREILDCPPNAGFAYPAYNVSYTLVDFLVAAGKPKFKKFIDLLKAGKTQEEALKEAYDFDSSSLEERWRAYCTDYLIRNR